MDSDLRSISEASAKNRRALKVAGIALFVLSGALLAYSLLIPKHGLLTGTTKPVPNAPDAFAGITLSAKSAIVYDLTTGAMLYGKNETAQLPLASITKLLSVYAATDALSNTTPVTITKNALAMDGDSGLSEGQQFRFSDLARFALVASSNDAAEAIAEASEARKSVSGVDLLAGAAAAAGLTQTYALNGTGLDETTTTAGAYGSAKDIAILAGKLLQKAPEIAHATIDPAISITSLGGTNISAHNTNPDVSMTPGLLLSKTGYTDLAGGNLVVVFDAGIGHPVAITVLGSTRDERFTDSNKLLAATIAHFAGITPSP